MEAVRWWAIHSLPARGQLTNVSALVLPASRPVAEDDRQDRQLPMFEDTRLLLRTLADLAEGLRETARVQRQQQDLLQQQIRRISTATTPSEPRESRPSNSKWRTWRGFVLDLQALEARVPRRVKVTKAKLGELGPDSARTISRTMECYGLTVTDWPPSTWNPDEERVYTPKNRR